MKDLKQVKPVLVYLNIEKHTELKHQAIDKNTSVSEIIRELVEKHLEVKA